MANVETYSPKNVAVIVGGVAITGFAEGTFIVLEREVDSFTKVVGADGDVSRTANANKSGSCTITLKQTSDSNDVLSGILLADEITLRGQFPFLLKDTNGRTLAESPCGWIRRVPNSEFGSDQTNREWIVDLSELIVFTGGNN